MPGKFRRLLKAAGRALKDEAMDEFGISGTRKMSRPSVLKHEVFWGVYIKGHRTVDQLTLEEQDLLSSELVGRIGVDDFKLYQDLWRKYVESIQSSWGASSLPTVGGFERWLRRRLTGAN